MTNTSKFNEGQYGLKPWLANVIMGLLELIMVIVWVLGSLLTGFTAALSLNIKVMESWDQGATLALCGGFLVWNLLVWLIKPLRTKFNYKETWYNFGFIAISLFETFFQN
jgi:hypothetical protein